jgi:hypothetical protein
MGSESTAVQTTRYVSIADGERAGGGGKGEGGNRMEAIVSGRQRLQIDRGGDNDSGEESEEAAGEGENDTEAPLSGSVERKE